MCDVLKISFLIFRDLLIWILIYFTKISLYSISNNQHKKKRENGKRFLCVSALIE
jgi:hypothetical protein